MAEVDGEMASADLPRRQATKVNCKILQKIPWISKRCPWQKWKESARQHKGELQNIAKDPINIETISMAEVEGERAAAQR